MEGCVTYNRVQADGLNTVEAFSIDEAAIAALRDAVLPGRNSGTACPLKPPVEFFSS